MTSSEKLEPFGQRVIVEDPPATEESGLIVPADAVPLKRGIIVATPWGNKSEETDSGNLWNLFSLAGQPDLAVGDVVLYPPDCGIEIDPIHDRSRRILDLECIRAVERHPK